MVLDFQTLVAPETAEFEENIPDTEVSVVEADDKYGKMTVEPLEPGYGMTLGNALRRVLYSSLPGTAITWVKIEGVLHEYATIPHVREEVSEFLMNVKSIRLRSEVDRPGKLRLEVAGEGEVCAGDIISSSDFEVVNPELHLAAMDSAEAKFSVEMNLERGKGYVEAAQGEGHPIGTLPVDAVFTPIRKVKYGVETTRVGQRTDLERLVLEVWTDGTVAPVDAVRQAGDILVNQFFLFSNAQKSVEEGAEGTSVALKIPAEHYNIPVERLELSSRTLNCLKRAGINRVGEVLEMTKPELLRIRNFGDKSYDELFGRLRDMDLVPPELDPDLVGTEPADQAEPADGTEPAAEAESEDEGQPAPEEETAS